MGFFTNLCRPLGRRKGSEERAAVYAAGGQGRKPGKSGGPAGAGRPLGGRGGGPGHATPVRAETIQRRAGGPRRGRSGSREGRWAASCLTPLPALQQTPKKLCLGVALLGGPAEPANGLGLVLLCAPCRNSRGPADTAPQLPSSAAFFRYAIRLVGSCSCLAKSSHSPGSGSAPAAARGSRLCRLPPGRQGIARGLRCTRTGGEPE